MIGYYFKRLLLTVALFFLVQAVRLALTSGFIELLGSQLVYWIAWLLSGEGIVLPSDRSQRLGLAVMLLFGFCFVLQWVLGNDDEAGIDIGRGREWSQPPSRQRNLHTTSKRNYL